MNKRGQGLSINAIILIVLGVLVLIALIIGFAIGWSKIFPWLKPSDNVKDIVDSCSLACSGASKYNYCSEKRELVTEEVTLKNVTCNFLAKEKTSYGISRCTALSCDNLISSAGTKADAESKLNEPCKSNPTIAGGTAKIVEYLDAVTKTLMTTNCLA